MILVMGVIAGSSRSFDEIIYLAAPEEGAAPVISGDGLWSPEDRARAPRGQTLEEMKLSSYSMTRRYFLPSSDDFIILDPTLTIVSLYDPIGEIPTISKGWTALIINPNPSFLPPKLTASGKFVPHDSLYWPEILRLVADDDSVFWFNVSWTENLSSSSTVIVYPTIGELFPYWRPRFFTYLYVIEVLYLKDERGNGSEVIVASLYMYQLIFEESPLIDDFWLYSRKYDKNWWIGFYVLVNSVILIIIGFLVFRYKRDLQKLRQR